MTGKNCYIGMVVGGNKEELLPEGGGWDTKRIPWDLRGGGPFWDLHHLILLLVAIGFRLSQSRPAEIAR